MEKKKEVKKSEKDIKKPDILYNVVIETLVPTSITYRIYAQNPEEALDKMKRANPTNIQPILRKKRDLKATIYEYGSLIIKLTKQFR